MSKNVELNDKKIQILEVAEKLFQKKGLKAHQYGISQKRQKLILPWFRIILGRKKDCLSL